MTRIRFFLAASSGLALVASCGHHTSNGGLGGDEFVGDDSGSASGTDGGGASSTMPSEPSAAYADGGIACGQQGGCATSETCCYPSATGTTPAAPPAPTCTAGGSCTGSTLSCSSTQHCSGGEVCCFAYDTSGGPNGGGDAGTAGGGAGSGLGFALTAMTFTAQCADQCPSGDMIHYQLCASAADCASGEMCIPGTYTPYCAAAGGGFGGGFPSFDGGGAGPGLEDDDGGSD